MVIFGFGAARPPEVKKGIQVAPSHHMLASASKQLTFRRAALVAATSIERKVVASADVRDTVDYNLELIELQIACMNAELKFLDALLAMNRASKELTLFKLFDRDGNGQVDLHELAAGFQKMDPTKAHAGNVEDAYKSICKADMNNDGLLDYNDFLGFLEDFREAMDATFDQLCQLLVLFLCLKDDGKAILKENLEIVRHQMEHKDPLEAAHHWDQFDDEISEVRTALLFQMIDYQGFGKVQFQEVVERLFFVTKGMDVQTRKAMFMLDEDDPRELDFYQFSAILSNVVAASPYADFNDVADAMTLAACHSTKISNKDLEDLFMSVEMKTVLSQKLSKHHLTEITGVQFARMETLFLLWDEDKSGYLDLNELVLGLRKFQRAMKTDDTVHDALQAIVHFDKDRDQQLGIEEFSQILAKFAKAMQIPLKELIDFMVVESAMCDNDEKDRQYLEKIKSRVLKQIRKEQPKTPIFNLLAGALQQTALSVVCDMAQEVETEEESRNATKRLYY